MVGDAPLDVVRWDKPWDILFGRHEGPGPMVWDAPLIVEWAAVGGRSVWAAVKECGWVCHGNYFSQTGILYKKGKKRKKKATRKNV